MCSINGNNANVPYRFNLFKDYEQQILNIWVHVPSDTQSNALVIAPLPSTVS